MVESRRDGGRNPTTYDTIPFSRDSFFVERPILDLILQRTSELGTRIGVVGLGGLAIEYAYRIRDTYLKPWVFWVHASSAVRFEESYRQIAAYLQLPGWSEPKMDVLRLVHAFLSDETHGQWRMVVDNADTAEVMFESSHDGMDTNITTPPTELSLSEYLPRSAKGSILITSRSRDVLEGMDLVRKLDYMPLAITQAAAYINQRAPRIDLSWYIEMLQKDNSERSRLLQKHISDPRRDRKASNSIIITCMFDREAIPDYLLRGQYTSAHDSEIGFEDDLATLRAYNLIGIDMKNHLFNMHSLVQLSTRTWLEIHKGGLERWQERYIEVMGAAFPEANYDN
ncbi:hypothetical protein EDD37DRAFT_660448 [Exophiala viscosa]|uniref:uncharacterized protein n=1 Tax=Exophiala viscosa TaxID=2486360 RepID=UPI0021941022|nr:hypothetical protein EDD37DRAFT_660448 [Exophiala viscosa]